MELWKNIKGFLIEMFFSIKGMFVEYCKEIFEPVKEEICKNKWCKFGYYTAFWFGILLSLIIFGFILYYGVGMLLTFAFLGFGLLLSFLVLGIGMYLLHILIENRVLQIALFPIVMFVLFLVVYCFNWVLR